MTDKVEVSMLEVLGLLKEGYTFADMQGVEPQQLEALYALGYQYYNAQNYEDAAKVFQGLCLYEPTEERFFMGLAACEQSLKHYERAADIYSVCCVLSGLTDPKPMYYAALCLLKANRQADAVTALQSLEIMGRDGKFKQQDDEFLTKGRELLALLQPKAE